MKLTTPLLAGLACVGLLITATAQDAVKFEVPGVTAPAASKPAATTAPAKAAAAPAAQPAAGVQGKFTDTQLMEAYGFIFMMETRMAGQMEAFEMSPALKDAMVRGIALAMKGGDLPYDAQQAQAIQVQLQEFMGKRQAAFMAKVRGAQVAASAEYFAKLKAEKNVTALPSGLYYEVVTPGKGAVPKPGQLVTMHYTGSLVGGQVFDSSVQRGQPAEFLMVVASEKDPSGVIPGLYEGLQKTGAGGKLKLHIPAALAYGDEGAPPAIPPGAALIFEVEILTVKDAPKDGAAK